MRFSTVLTFPSMGGAWECITAIAGHILDSLVLWKWGNVLPTAILSSKWIGFFFLANKKLRNIHYCSALKKVVMRHWCTQNEQSHINVYARYKNLSPGLFAWAQAVKGKFILCKPWRRKVHALFLTCEFTVSWSDVQDWSLHNQWSVWVTLITHQPAKFTCSSSQYVYM